MTVSAVTLVCLGPAAWGFPAEYRSALRSWILGTAAMVLSDVLFIISPNHPWSGFALPALVALGVAEWRHAIRKFGGARSRERWPYIFIGASTLLTLAAGGGYFASVVTSSISGGSDLDVTSLIARADAAMYEAKRLGRDRVVVDSQPSPS